MAEEDAPPDEPQEAVPAGFWARVGSAFIDLLAWGLAMSLCEKVLGIRRAAQLTPGQLLFFYLGGFAYAALMPAAFGGTLGKLAIGARIVTLDGEPIGLGRSLARALAYLLSALPLGGGFIAAAFTPAKRGLHDYVAGTRVVYAGEARPWAGLLAAVPMVLVLGIALTVGVLAPRPPRPPGPPAEPAAAPAAPPAAAPPSAEARRARLMKEMALLSEVTKLNMAVTGIKFRSLQGPQFPKSLAGLEIPLLELPDHPPTTEVELYGAEACTGSAQLGQRIDGAKLRHTGRWGYVADPKAFCAGTVFIDCAHPDLTGKPYYQH